MSPVYLAHIKCTENTWVFQSIEDHCRGVAELASEAAAAFHAESWAKLCGQWHDLGKYSESFQKHIKAASGYDTSIKDPGKTDHASAGAIYAQELLNEQGAFLPIAYCVCGHHTGLHDYYASGAANLKYHLQEIEKLDPIRPFLIQTPLPPLSPPRISYVSQDDFMISWHLWIRMLYSCLVDADSLDTERFMTPEKYNRRRQFDTIETLKHRLDIYLQNFKNCPQTPLNKIRTNIQNLCRESGKGPKDIYSLTVPTGGGKTLSSLVWAMEHAVTNGNQRIIIAIPYTSIVVQTANTLKEIFGADNVIEHHSNVNFDSEEDNKGKLATENWDAPIIVTTNVQLFESLFANKRSRCRKLHNIVNSILILDEVQMLPPENLRPIVEVLKSLQKDFGTSIIMTTATQPALAGTIGTGLAKFQGLEAKEIIIDKEKLFEQLRRVDIRFAKEKYTYEKLADEISNFSQILCVVNTRKDAKMLYDAMAGRNSIPVVHLSRMMCQQHIMDKIEEVRHKLNPEHPQPVIVISTQLIEAGVDIDFPVVYRAMAGLDSIAQAAGRCNREGRLRRGKVTVFDFEDTRSRGLMRKAAQTTEELLLMGKKDFLSPMTTKTYFESYYNKVNNMDVAEIEKTLYKETPQFATAARQFKLIDNEGITVFVPYKDGTNLIEEMKRGDPSITLMRKLQRYSVSIPSYYENKLLTLGAMKVDDFTYFLPDEDCYDSETGLCYDNPFINSELIL